jgi:septal ring factor EnvC (AmiA/AmiB activator)
MANRTIRPLDVRPHQAGPVLSRAGISAALILAILPAAQAQQAPKALPADPAAAAQQLNLSRQRLDETNRRAKELGADLDSIGRERAQITAKLQEAGRSVQAAEVQLTKIEGRLEELQQQQDLLQGSLQQRHGDIGKLLAAMQRMGRNPPPVIITRREDALEMVRSAMLLSKAFPHLQGQAQHLVASLTELTRIIDESKTERDRLTSTLAAHKDSQARLDALKELKRQTQTDRQQELAQVNRAAQEIGKSVADLSELIAKLDRTIAERTQLGAYEAEVARLPQPAATPPVAEAKPAMPPTQPAAPAPAAPAATPPTRGSGPTVVAAASPPPLAKPPAAPQAVVLAPTGAFAANPGRIKPAVPFHLAKAQLPYPAQGRRVLNFGEKSQYGSSSKGIVLETRPGAQVTAPCDGWVVYAGEFRTYGQLLIINAGGGYHVLLAGLSQIDVQLGQFLVASEPVGTMRPADKGKIDKTRLKDAAPLLFVEFRKDGQPINPDPWWAEASQKVQG